MSFGIGKSVPWADLLRQKNAKELRIQNIRAQIDNIFTQTDMNSQWRRGNGPELRRLQQLHEQEAQLHIEIVMINAQIAKAKQNSKFVLPNPFKKPPKPPGRGGRGPAGAFARALGY